MGKKCWMLAGLLVSVCGMAPGQCPSADVTGDYKVDLQDLAAIAGQWLEGTVTTTEIQWVAIPAGQFVMGDALGEGAVNERPLHTVTLTKGFKISQVEVTNAQYAAFLNGKISGGLVKVVSGVVYDVLDTTNTKPWFSTSTAISQSLIAWADGVFTVRQRDGRPQDRHPVVYVSWYGAQAFCTANGGQLPTEAQWEYAARGGLEGKRWAWGSENIDHNRANYSNSPSRDFENSSPFVTGTMPHTTPVGLFPANGYGLYDMTGNVQEWCNDWYGVYSSPAQIDPTGPATGANHIARGGGWNGDASFNRVAFRASITPDLRAGHIGFRVVLN